MGKAGKWIREILTGGKRDEKNISKRNSVAADNFDVSLKSSASAENLEPPNAIVVAVPTIEKRRWSFGRSRNTDKKPSHKNRRSFDSVLGTKLISNTLLDYANQQKRIKPAEVQHNVAAASRSSSLAPDAAATRIQAAFRSYLARRALRALRGLVKIQALVRGHLVRKQTTAMVRCTNALMSIQVRARVQRIHSAEEPQPDITMRKGAQRGLVAQDIKDVGIDETNRGRVSTRKNTHFDHPQIPPPMNHGYKSSGKLNSSGRISVSRPDKQVPVYPSSTPTTPTREISTRTHKNSHNYSYYTSKDTKHQLVSNYMANTESSRAKVRSQSEPKQRPIKQKNKSRRTASSERIDFMQAQGHSSQNHKNQHNNWLLKLYRSSKSNKDMEFDTASISSSSSSYCRTLYAYELQAAVNFY